MSLTHCFIFCFGGKDLMCLNRNVQNVLTFSLSELPYLARILGSLIVARLVPVTVNSVPPLWSKQEKGLFKDYLCIDHCWGNQTKDPILEQHRVVLWYFWSSCWEHCNQNCNFKAQPMKMNNSHPDLNNALRNPIHMPCTGSRLVVVGDQKAF